ncbi:MAG: hypothetical protein D6704_05395 [Nitrospirae bacterium]|nr:MAG: hypothetical protein D6704_05395 [Nitrospirota bacterium]
MTVSPTQTPAQSQALSVAHRHLYESPAIDAKLYAIINTSSQAALPASTIHHILRISRAIVFDTHVEVVSGHHTGTYLRFASVADVPECMTLIAQNMADWICSTFRFTPIAGLVTTASAAYRLAMRVVELAADTMPLRLILTPFSHETGKIGIEISGGEIREGERFVALNDVTTRGMCVSKLGHVVTNHGGQVAGMMVFARRDSGQFPYMQELTTQLPFYYTADLIMPQWEPEACPLCQTNMSLMSWKDIEELKDFAKC